MVLELNITSAPYTFTLPVKGFIGTVSWGEGSSATSCSPLPGQPPCDGLTHTYSSTGTYTVRIGTGNGDSLQGFGLGCSTFYSAPISAVTSWGDWASDPNFTSLDGAFSGASALTSVPSTFPSFVTDARCMFEAASGFNQDISGWDVHNVTTMNSMFASALSFNQPLNGWNVSHVSGFAATFLAAHSFNQPLNSWNTSSATRMSEMFFEANSFDQNLASWDVSHVYTMADMFKYASSFSGSIGGWDTSTVTDMSNMFYGATSFNSDISQWNTSNVTNMWAVFENAIAFNQPLNSWDTSSVTDMQQMFEGASAFNQPLGDWDTSNVEYMGWLFHNAAAFNQTLSAWDVREVTDGQEMFDGSNLSTSNYSSLLASWGQQAIQSNVTLGSVPAHYTAAASSGRQALVNAGWVFTDLGLEASPTPTPAPPPSNSSSTESPSLASTGFNLLPTLELGTVLFLAGMTLLIWRRRRTY